MPLCKLTPDLLAYAYELICEGTDPVVVAYVIGISQQYLTRAIWLAERHGIAKGLEIARARRATAQ